MDQGIRHRASSHEGVAELIAEALLKSAIHIRRERPVAMCVIPRRFRNAMKVYFFCRNGIGFSSILLIDCK